MLRFVRLPEHFARAPGSRGAALIAVAVLAGGCSAGFELPPLSYNGGPTPTGTVAPVPPEPMYGSRSSARASSDYRQDYRPDSGYGRPYARMDDRGAPPPSQYSDNGVRVAGLPEPYDRGPSYDAAPSRGTQPSRSVPFDTPRHQPTPPVPPRSSYEPTPPPAPAAYVPPTAPAQLDGDTIEVKPGDTLYSLSQTHRVSVAELMQANNLPGPNLRVGQRLVLPANRRRPPRRVASLPSAEAPTPAPYATPRLPERSYVPPTPEHPAAPAASAPITDPAAGPIVPPLVESPPTPSTPAADASPPSAPIAPAASRSAGADDAGWSGSYTVARGDSLYAIARKHGVRLNDLERANGITNPRKVMPGTVLKVPQGGEPKTVRAAAAPTPMSEPEAPPRDVGTPAVQPTIINSRTRVAALGRDTTDVPAATPSTSAPPPSAGHREAATQPATSPSMGKFRWPARGKVIANFGNHPGTGQNDGINISLPRGTDVHAAESGVVTYAGDGVQGYGNLVLIRHQEGWITAYAHNDQLMVKSGESVKRGQVIAKAGATGSVSQPQLHFEIRQGTKAVDPIHHLEH